MSELNLRAQIIEKLEFNPSIDATHVNVTVDDRVACLSGRVPSLAEKAAAVSCAQQIPEIRAVADELVVGFTPRQEIKDQDLARQVAALVQHSITPEPIGLRISVESGWVTLTGDVDSFFLGRNIERLVLTLHGVEGVTNRINHRTIPDKDALQSQIRKVFERDLFEDPVGIGIESFGGKVTLSGFVHSEMQRALAVQAVATLDGVTFVEDCLDIRHQ